MKPVDSCLDGTPRIPGLSDNTAEPHFHAPWQAKLFALTLSLQERGLFDWPDWTERLARHLRVAAHLPSEAAGAEHAAHYYTAWMQTLEEFLEEAGAAENGSIEEVTENWKRAAQATPHGHPILYENGLAASSKQ
ncbi:nitrile hydratase accessory protein [Paracoccus saliphilus]|uniref:Nitrile hydratase accessory protein n=1 Tax=Paracoccus saliphilus TaxID=405559 RepID=A0AA45W1U7_9RHOB|nr:nitrile hydratase accessory protein [Paracoccus saliphilus]SIS62323.1 nitrile hydratase accessory protein [Paracoccus saliphilus]